MADYEPNPESLGTVRLLINDVTTIPATQMFRDDEIHTFLALEGGHVKLAAAQALDTIADNEALTSKVIRTQDLSTDGAKVADGLRKRAGALREQHRATVVDDDEAAGGGIFTVEAGPACRPELAPYPSVLYASTWF
jgi:hypothetical protein